MSHYLISEASRLVDEESHVLRYWEEELALKIPRNDLGHRYYTEVQLEIFRTIKELKQQGYQLKEIKQWLEEMEKEKSAEPKEDEPMDNEVEEEKPDLGDIVFPAGVPLPAIPPVEDMRADMAKTVIAGAGSVNPASTVMKGEGRIASVPESPRMQEFRQLMAEILTDVMDAGYTKMTDEITDQVSRRVIKEINYLDREREEWEEEQFKQLDEAIRSCQRRGKFRAEAAAAAVPEKRKRWKLGSR